jgi:hypothetical protein
MLGLLLFCFVLFIKSYPPLSPLGERVRVRGKKGIGYLPTPPPFPSPLKGEGFHYYSISLRVVFSKNF